MPKYKTTAIVDLFAGSVGLSDNQAARRSPHLKKVKKGVYEITAPVQFKAGEIITLAKPDKITLAKLELFKPEKAGDPGPVNDPSQDSDPEQEAGPGN